MEDKPTYTTDSQPDPPRDLPPWAISLAREIVRQAAAPERDHEGGELGLLLEQLEAERRLADPPARAAVGVASLPKGARVEIAAQVAV